ncbi:MAG: outer membrane protein assembly factor BamA [Phycisphaerales bacterium]
MHHRLADHFRRPSRATNALRDLSSRGRSCAASSGLGQRLGPLVLAATVVLGPATIWPAAEAAGQTALPASPGSGNESGLVDRQVIDVIFVGLPPELDDLVRNNVRSAAGDPFDPAVVRGDVQRLERLGRFGLIESEAELREDGTVAVTFTLTVQPPVNEVQVVGNKAVSDQDILGVVRQARGGPRDDYLIDRAIRDIRELYVEKGYYLTEVSIDRRLLEEQATLVFRIIEGPRVRIRQITFDGNANLGSKLLRPETKTRTHLLLLRQGVLDETVLAEDRVRLVNFYKQRGYLDVRVDSVVDLSPDNREASVRFLIDEGPRFTLGTLRVENIDERGTPLKVFSDRQIAAMIPIKSGDVYSADKVDESLSVLEDAWGTLGYIDVDVRAIPSRTGKDNAVVDLLLVVREGDQWIVGNIEVKDNFLTRDKVIRRLVTLRPGRPFDAVEKRETERRLQRTRYFGQTRVTEQDPRPDLYPGERDVLIEVSERNTGSINFGAAVGSDAGVFGEFSIQQDNFDLFDLPESFGELLTGRAFRGAGQRFNMTLRPGNELFEYSASLTEPKLFDRDISLSVSGSYRERQFNDFDEERASATIALGRSFGDVWQAGLRLRGESIELSDVQDDAATELLLDRGPDTLTSLGFSLTRTTIGTLTRPGRGSRLELSMDRAGALGGDYNFWRAEADFTVFLTLAEDFLGRKSTLRLNTRAGYIFDADPRVPTYERFYLGGRSFRGFDFRTVSPKGVRIDNGEQADSIGGSWLFFAGAQYEVPLFEEAVTGVLFVDSGTVTDAFGLDDYRVSVGLGVRLYIPQLGPVPIAFDFGFPIRDAFGDEKQVLSFSAELPF